MKSHKFNTQIPAVDAPAESDMKSFHTRLLKPRVEVTSHSVNIRSTTNCAIRSPSLTQKSSGLKL